MFSFFFYLELLFPALFNTNSHQLSGGITGGGVTEQVFEVSEEDYWATPMER